MNAAVRELKTHLSSYLRRVKAGEQVIITDHGEPCAVIQPFPPRTEDARMRVVAMNPNITWAGRPVVLPEAVAVGGRSLADIVVEDRG
jgi:prevent-host-death family protein